MRRIFKHDFLATNPSTALKYSISKMLLALLFFSIQPSLSLAQTDPFTQTKPATGNPFADIPTSDASDSMPTESVTPKAAKTFRNPFDDEVLEETNLQSAAQFADPGPVTVEAQKTLDATDVPEPEPNNSTASTSSAIATNSGNPQASTADTTTMSKNTGWLSWLLENWYWPLAALLFALSGLYFSNRNSATKDFGRPRIKTTGSFKRSDRFQKDEKETTETEGITSELAAADDRNEEPEDGNSSDMFDFEEPSSDELFESESLPVANSTTEPAGGRASIDESDDDFLELMMGESDETQIEKTAEDPVEIDDLSRQEVDQPGSSEVADDDDFLELMLDETQETVVTNPVADSEDVVDSLLQEDAIEVDQSLQKEMLEEDEDAFLDLLLDEDEDASPTDEVLPEVASSSQSTEIEAADPVESTDSLTLDSDSDEFIFDFEDDTPAETESAEIKSVETEFAEAIDEGVSNKTEESAPANTDHQPTPVDEVAITENDDLSIDTDDTNDLDGVESDHDDQPSIAGGVAVAAGGIAAGLGALLATKDSSATTQPDEGAAVDELREQLARVQEEQQQKVAEISAQRTEIKALKAELERGSALAEEVGRLKAELQDLKDAQLDSATEKETLQQHAGELKGELELAEKKASEVEAKLTAAESSIASLEKEKRELATELENSSNVSEENEKLEAEISALKSQAKEASTENEQLQSQAKQLRDEVSELKELNQQAAADSKLESVSPAAARLHDAAEAKEVDASGGSRQLQQLEAQYNKELALRKETEAMLLEAEQQRTDVAIALRDLRKQTKGQNESAVSAEQIDDLKKELEDSKLAKEELSQQLDSFREKLQQEHGVSKELTGKLSAAQEKVSAVTVLEDEWTQKLAALESQIEAKGKESDRLTTQLSAAQESLEEFEGEIAELKAREEEHQATLAKQETLLLESKSNLESAMAENSEMEVALGDLKEKAGALSYAQLEEALASVARLGEERNNLTSKLEQTRSSGEEMTRQNAQLSERVIQLEKQLEQSLSDSSGVGDVGLQLAEEKEHLRHAKEQNSILVERVSGLEQRLKNQLVDTEKLDSLQQKLDSQTEMVTLAKEENATLKERVAQLTEQFKVSQHRSEKLEQVAEELSQEKARLAEMNQTYAITQQRIKVLEDQIAESKQVSLQLSETNERLARASSDRISLEQKSAGLLQQLNQTNAIAEKNELLNKQLGALQRDLEAVERSKRELEQKLAGETSANTSGSEDSRKLERILGQLESQNRRISQLVSENRNMAAELASAATAPSKNTVKQAKGKAIPKGCDDLTEIVGIGPKSRGQLYDVGVKTFRHIAGWTEKDVEKYSEKLGYKSNRIEQEKWVSQAKKLS